jgi:hypothetical protein
MAAVTLIYPGKPECWPEVKNSWSQEFFFFFKGGIFWNFSFFIYDIQHCFICHPLDSTGSVDAGK